MAHTVLVADDSRTIRKIVGMALKASSYELVEADSARSTMNAVQQRPDIILLDYFMPDGSGYEICRAIKSNAATNQIPVVMLGGTHKNFDENLARQAGADEVVWKPFKTDQLIGAIETALARGGKAQGAPPQAQSAPQQSQSSGAPLPPPNPFAGGGARPQPQAQQQPQQQRPSPMSGSQPRIPAPMPQGSASRPAQPHSGSQERIQVPQQQTPPPAQSQASGGGGGAGVDRAELEGIIRDQVKDIVREELPNMIRGIMGDLFNQKILPRLVKHSEEKVTAMLDEQLHNRVRDQVRVELERLLSEE
jgi:DNA-binding response OmpR family regulator